MANQSHEAKLREGARSWNIWRAENPYTAPNLEGISLSLSERQLGPMHGGPVNLSGARLRGADLSNAQLAEADLSRADLTNAQLWGARLNGASFRGAVLEGTDFTSADLENADFEGAKFKAARLHRARNLTREQLEAAKGDTRTTLPDHLSRPGHWGDPEAEPEPEIADAEPAGVQEADAAPEADIHMGAEGQVEAQLVQARASAPSPSSSAPGAQGRDTRKKHSAFDISHLIQASQAQPAAPHFEAAPAPYEAFGFRPPLEAPAEVQEAEPAPAPQAEVNDAVATDALQIGALETPFAADIAPEIAEEAQAAPLPPVPPIAMPVESSRIFRTFAVCLGAAFAGAMALATIVGPSGQRESANAENAQVSLSAGSQDNALAENPRDSAPAPEKAKAAELPARTSASMEGRSDDAAPQLRPKPASLSAAVTAEWKAPQAERPAHSANPAAAVQTAAAKAEAPDSAIDGQAEQASEAEAEAEVGFDDGTPPLPMRRAAAISAGSNPSHRKTN